MSKYADSYIRREKTNDNSEALLEMMEMIREAKIVPDEKKDRFEELLVKCQYQTKPLIETYKARLWKHWQEYVGPTQTKLEAIAEYESTKIQEFDGKESAAQKKVNTDGEVKYIASTRDLSQVTIKMNRAEYCLDPVTGKLRTQPLQYAEDIVWEDFSNNCHKNPFSKTVDLYKTIMNLMQECQRVGCTREQFTYVLKLMVYHEFPESYQVMSYEEDAECVFDMVIGLLDFAAHLTRMRECMKKISRKPEHGIQTPVRAFQSLVMELLSVQLPDSSETDNRKESAKQACKSIKYFVTRKAWHEIEQFKELFREKNGRFATLTEIFGFVNWLESDPDMRPSHTLSLEKQENLKIDLFMNDTQQNWAWQFGSQSHQTAANSDDDFDSQTGDENDDDQEVFLSEQPLYANHPLMPPPSMRYIRDNHDSGERSHAPTAPQGTHTGEVYSHGHGPQTRSKGAAADISINRFDAKRRADMKKKKGRDTQNRGRTTTPRSANVSSFRRNSPFRRESRSKDRSSSEKRRISPGTGRERLYMRSPTSGSYRSISRNRIMRRNSKGELVNRSVSRDRNPVPKSGQCAVCWKYHDQGKCDYGKVRKAKFFCKCKQGYHHVSICLNQPGTGRSPSRNRDKSPKPFGSGLSGN